MTEVTDAVAVETEDLRLFVDGGRRYTSELQSIFERVVTRRSMVTAAIGDGGPDPMAAMAGGMSAGDPFASLLQEATDNNGFVSQILEALEGYDGGSALTPARFGTIDDRSVIEDLDPATRSSLTVARYFSEIFDGDKVDGDLQDRFVALANSENLAEIEQRLRDGGYEGAGLDAALTDITFAGAFYGREGNASELRALDDANDSNTDGDQKLRATDAWLRTVALTRSDSISSDVMGDSALRDIAVVRHHAITAWLVDQGLEPGDLQGAFDGDSRLGALSVVDQQVLVDGFVGSNVAATLSEDSLAGDGRLDVFGTVELGRLRSVSREDYSPALVELLTSSMSDQAIRLELVSDSLPPAGSEGAAFVASVLAEGTLELVAGDEASFIDGLGREQAALFAASLSLDRSFDQLMPLGSMEFRSDLAAVALSALTTAAGPGGTLSPGGEGFVLMTQSTAAHGAYQSFGQSLPFASALAEATAVAVNAGDAEAQAFHRERLTEVFEDPRSVLLLAANPFEIDQETRTQLLHMLIHGHQGADGEQNYWRTEDFADGAKTVSIDLAVEQASTYYEVANGRRLPSATEARLRDLAETEQFQDLIGLHERSGFSLRSQFMAMAVEAGWSADEFSGDQSGWENASVNGEYLVWLASRINRDLSAAELANLRAIGESAAGQEHLGLGINTTDEERLAYVDHIVANGWTVATFEADDPIHNDIINNAFAAAAFASLGPSSDMARDLAALDAADAGYAESFVRTALGVSGGGGDDLVARIVEEIGGVDAGAGLQLIPIHVRTGGRHAEMMLFETVRDGKRIVVDLNGKSYSDPGDWYHHNGLPPARVTYPGVMGESPDQSVFVGPGSGDHYQLVHRVSKNYPDTWVEKYGDWVITGAVIVGGVLMIVGSGGLATPVVGAGAAGALGTAGTVLVGSVAAYEIGSGAKQLYDHVGHGGDWDSPEATSAYFSLGEGFLTAVSVGSYTAARRGVAMSGRLAGTLTYANRASEGLEIGLNVQQALQIIDSDLSAGEKRRQLAILGVLGAAEYGIPFAANRAIARNHPGLADLDPGELSVAISNGTVSIDALRTGLGTGQASTASVYTTGDVPPQGRARRDHLLDPNNWTPERQLLHDQLIADAIDQALVFDAEVGGVPTIYAMRGNTAAGKTRAIPGNIPELEAATAATQDMPHRAVNPDNFKVDIRAAESDIPLTSTQVHEESSILAERFRNELAALERENGDPISFLVDQRLGPLEDVQRLQVMAAETGRQLNIYDIDAPLEVSLVGVLMRTPGGRDPIPPFSIIADDGFGPVRADREEVIAVFTANPEIGNYQLFVTAPDGSKTNVLASSGSGRLSGAGMPDSLEVTPDGDINRLRHEIITDQFVEDFVRTLDEDYGLKVRLALEPYVGYSWEDAIGDHSKKPPVLD